MRVNFSFFHTVEPTWQQHAFSPMICLVRTYNRAGKCQDFNQNLGGPFCNKLQLTRAFYLLYAILNFFLHFPRVQNILFFVFTVWKNQRFTLTPRKIFREINVQLYPWKLISRKFFFCSKIKCEWKFHNFNTVVLPPLSACEEGIKSRIWSLGFSLFPNSGFEKDCLGLDHCTCN